MANLPPFVYDPVSAREIRLLTPVASVSNTGLTWSLRKANIDDPSLRFIALSYAWELQSRPVTFSICCNEYQLQVHYNLYTALPFLARRFEANTDTATAYWIDAICINQRNDEEKVSQIRLMNTIYRRADKVCVWLGLAPRPELQDLIPRAIQLLPTFVRESTRCHQSSAAFTRGFVVNHDLSHFGHAGWEAILHLIDNNYLRRVWVVQELALAKEVLFLCGDCEISPDLLETAVVNNFIIARWALYDNSTPSRRIEFPVNHFVDERIFTVRGIFNYAGEEDIANQTIRITNLLTDSTCSAPQDRVLGILGMAEEEFGDACKDLHIFTSIPDLYTRFSILLFEASELAINNWWIYLSTAFNKRRMAGLPSWVPDLHDNLEEAKRQPLRSILATRALGNSLWQASSRPSRVALGSCPGEIVLLGKLLDEISLVHPEVPHFGPALLNGLIDLINWERNLADTVLYNTTGELHISEETYWPTISIQSYTEAATGAQFSRELWLEFREAGQRLLHLVQRHNQAESSESPTLQSLRVYAVSDEEREDLSNLGNLMHPIALFMAALRFTHDYQLFNTKLGRFGFTCTGLQPGDVVCVFNDSMVPYVLRRVDDRDGTARYKFVGDAYVHDLMYGEADVIDIAEEDIVLV